MMHIISSIVNSGNIIDMGGAKNTSVKKDVFQNTLLEQAVRIKKVSEARNLKPYEENEERERYPLVKKITYDASIGKMTALRSAAVINPAGLDTSQEDKEKMINPVKFKNAYHISER